MHHASGGHHSGHGYGGHADHGHQHGHAGHQSNSPAVQVSRENKKDALNLAQLLGLNSRRENLVTRLATAFGLCASDEPTAPVVGVVAPKSSSINWNKSTTQPQTSSFWRKFVDGTFRFTPSVGLFCLFVGLIMWLGVVYLVRHHEPAENFAKLSSQLYSKQLPTTKVNGQRLPTMMISDPAAKQLPASYGASYAAQPITASTADVPQAIYRGQTPAAAMNSYSPQAAPMYAAPALPPVTDVQAPPRAQRMRVIINR